MARPRGPKAATAAAAPTVPSPFTTTTLAREALGFDLAPAAPAPVTLRDAQHLLRTAFVRNPQGAVQTTDAATHAFTRLARRLAASDPEWALAPAVEHAA